NLLKGFPCLIEGGNLVRNLYDVITLTCQCELEIVRLVFIRIQCAYLQTPTSCFSDGAFRKFVQC
ncbi:MAG: hypothetical protein WCO86_19090, partial [Planctomycetota bacterium]